MLVTGSGLDILIFKANTDLIINYEQDTAKANKSVQHRNLNN